MKITAIFETTDLAEAAAAAVEHRVAVQDRQTVSLSGIPVEPYTEQPAIIAPGFENTAATGGLHVNDWNAGQPINGLWPYPAAPLTSIVAEQAPGGFSDETRLELEVAPEDVNRAEAILINRHGRSIVKY